MQAQRDAMAAAAEAAELEEKEGGGDGDVFDRGQGGCAEAVALRSSPSGESFATLATENHLDKRLVANSQLELSLALQDRLSVASVHTPADYVALPTVSFC